MMNIAQAYQLFQALRAHFDSPSYDYFKYHGKIAMAKNLDTRKDRFYYEKLSKHKDPSRFVLSNMVERNISWIGDLYNNDESEDIYNNWLKRQQSLGYIFKQDLDQLSDDFDSNLRVFEGDYPRLFSQMQRKQICKETFCIIAKMTNAYPYWSKHIEDQIVFPAVAFKMQKYTPFIQYDKDKCKALVLKHFGVPA